MGKKDMDAMNAKIAEGEKKEAAAKRKEAKKKLKAQRTSFWADFKKFITKGNIIDMAVGVVIGAAFSAIVNGLVKMIINPCISKLTGGVSLDGWKTVLIAADEEAKVAEVAILWGEWIQTIINFFIIALCIFAAVRIINGVSNRLRAKELAAKKIEEEKKKAEDKAKAEAAAAVAAEKEAQLQAFYANTEKVVALLEQLNNK